MATAPASIEALRLPADGTNPGLITLRTRIKPIKPSIPPRDEKILKEYNATMAERQAMQAAGQIISHDYGGFQPNISLLPDPPKESWPKKAWKRRAVCALYDSGHTDLYHVFFTRFTSSKLHPNPHVKDVVSGDVFLLKVSKIKDKDERRFYEDLKPLSISPEEIKRLIQLFVDYAEKVGKPWN